MTLEILDSSNATVVATFSTEPRRSRKRCWRPRRGGADGRGGIPNTSPLWRPTPEPFSAGAGMHRVVWTPVAAAGGRGGRGGGGGGRGGGGARLTGTFTAKLTANGKTYTQTFTVKPDPRAR